MVLFFLCFLRNMKCDSIRSWFDAHTNFFETVPYVMWISTWMPTTFERQSQKGSTSRRNMLRALFGLLEVASNLLQGLLHHHLTCASKTRTALQRWRRYCTSTRTVQNTTQCETAYSTANNRLVACFLTCSRPGGRALKCSTVLVPYGTRRRLQ